ncbi:hypothetical protein Tco_0853588 [Tanacetum coccineum]
MDNLKKQLIKEIIHEKDSKFSFSVIKVQFYKFLHSEELKASNYDGRHVRETFKDYTQMEVQSFKYLITKYMDSIEKCIVEKALHAQEIQKRLKSLTDRKLQIQECKIQKVKALDDSSGNTKSSKIVSWNDYSKTRNDQSSQNESSTSGNKSSRSGNECSERSNFGNDTDIRPSYDTKPMAEVLNTTDYNVFATERQHSEKLGSINGTYVVETVDSNVIPDSSDMSTNKREVEHNAKEPKDECVLFAS